MKLYKNVIYTLQFVLCQFTNIISWYLVIQEGLDIF